jgi:REJ domain
VVLPASSIPKLPDGTYTLRVVVSSFLGKTAAAELTFTKMGPGSAPVISIVGEAVQRFEISRGAKVSSSLEASSVCAGKSVQYLWESIDVDGAGAPALWAAVPPGYSRKDLNLAGPVAAAEAGKQYRLRLTAKFAGATQIATAEVTLEAVGAPLVAQLKGPSGDVKSDKTVTLDAGTSSDPDDPQGSKPMTFTWDCVREDFPQPCFASTNRGDQVGAKWSLPASLLAVDK